MEGDKSVIADVVATVVGVGVLLLPACTVVVVFITGFVIGAPIVHMMV